MKQYVVKYKVGRTTSYATFDRLETASAFLWNIRRYDLFVSASVYCQTSTLISEGEGMITGHKYLANVYEFGRNGIVEFDLTFSSVKEFRRWARAKYGARMTRIQAGEYVGCSTDMTNISVKLTRLY